MRFVPHVLALTVPALVRDNYTSPYFEIFELLLRQAVCAGHPTLFSSLLLRHLV